MKIKSLEIKNRLYIYSFTISALFLLYIFINTNSVNIPYWDQWDLGEVFQKFYLDNLSFTDLIQQHNEHRIFIPKIIFITLLKISEWNNIPEWNIIPELNFSFILISFTAVIVNELILFSFQLFQNKSSQNLRVCTLISVLLITSVVQYENFLWGFQIAWFLTNLCVIISIFLLRRLDQNKFKIFIAGVLCLIASLSSAHGLFSWFALIPMIFLQTSNNKRDNYIESKVRLYFNYPLALAWSAIGFLCFFLYFIGYEKPSHHPSTLTLLNQPGACTAYLLSITASSLVSRNDLDLSFILGFLILSILIGSSIFVLTSSSENHIKYSLPWISLGAFSLMFLGANTIGRCGFGIQQSFASRYTSPGMLTILSSLILAFIILESQWDRVRPDFKLQFIFAIALALGLFLPHYFNKLQESIHAANITKTERTEGLTCLKMIDNLDLNSASNQSCLSKLYPDPIKLKSINSSLVNLGLRRKPDLTFSDLDFNQDNNLCFPITEFDIKEDILSNSVILHGISLIKKSLVDNPSVIALSVGKSKPDKEPSLLDTIMFINFEKNFFDESPKCFSQSYTKVSWSASFSQEDLKNKSIVTIWIYDNLNTLFKIGIVNSLQHFPKTMP